MKKLMALSLALLMTLSLVACGSKTEQPSTGSNSSDAEATGFVPPRTLPGSAPLPQAAAPTSSPARSLTS